MDERFQTISKHAGQCKKCFRHLHKLMNEKTTKRIQEPLRPFCEHKNDVNWLTAVLQDKNEPTWKRVTAADDLGELSGEKGIKALSVLQCVFVNKIEDAELYDAVKDALRKLKRTLKQKPKRKTKDRTTLLH